MSSKSHIETAKDVLLAEANGIRKLADLIDHSFSEAVDRIVKASSYLIVTGVGKSGHIGRKISASFASTGTPSFFMHPTEASHGDLGMLVPSSTVLAISNSGESRELIDTLSFCKKNRVPVIAITQNPDSTLARLSSVMLQIPKVPEVCANGLAPTTSTTNTLALGDALVVAVMTEKGISRDDFGRHHPGGKLGRRLQTVSDWLITHPHDVPKIDKTTPMEDIITAISTGQNGCVAVVGPDNCLLGMITDGDLRRAMSGDFFEKIAEDIMTREPIHVTPTMLMSEVVELFSRNRISNAFIVEDGQPIGVVHTKLLLKEGYV